MPRLIVQLPLTGWGTDAEIAVRDALAEALRRGFRDHGYGRFLGIEDGVGRTNLIFAESNCDLDTLPVELIWSELRERGLLEETIIAYEVRRRGVEPRYHVVWPEGHAGEFDLG